MTEEEKEAKSRKIAPFLALLVAHQHGTLELKRLVLDVMQNDELDVEKITDAIHLWRKEHDAALDRGIKGVHNLLWVLDTALRSDLHAYPRERFAAVQQARRNRQVRG